MQPERYYLPLKMPELGQKARLPPVGFADADLLVALDKVEVREPLSAASLFQQRVNVWQGFDAGLGDGIQASKVVIIRRPASG